MCYICRVVPYPSSLDAEECYSTLLNTLRNIPGLDGTGNVAPDVGGSSQKRFVDQYLMGEMHREYAN
jgi:ubiquitin carboxyl-terminal hydrolase 14